MAEDCAAAWVAAAISEIVVEPVSVAQRARRILQVLDPVLRDAAASIALRDPEQQIRIPWPPRATPLRCTPTGPARGPTANWPGSG